jgi:hypothetical protein
VEEFMSDITSGGGMRVVSQRLVEEAEKEINRRMKFMNEARSIEDAAFDVAVSEAKMKADETTESEFDEEETEVRNITEEKTDRGLIVIFFGLWAMLVFFVVMNIIPLWFGITMVIGSGAGFWWIMLGGTK